MIQSDLRIQSRPTEDILSQAKSWGFVCEPDFHGSWQILPQHSKGRWKLHLVEDRWLLTVGNVPQVSMHPLDVVRFLERRRAWCSKLSPAEAPH